MKLKWILLAAALAVVGCNNEKTVTGRNNRLQTESGNKGAAPNQSLTVSNSSQQNSVPREGGNLDRGVTKDNDPSRNAPGAEEKPPTVGPGTK